MRPIKFRAWEPFNKKMYYEAIVGLPANPSVFCDGEWLNCTPESSIMQFTGLHDKNEKEIYEGDILDPFFDSGSNGTTLFKVIWSHHGFDLIHSDNRMTTMLFDRTARQGFTIIGNVHENPELIK